MTIPYQRWYLLRRKQSRLSKLSPIVTAGLLLLEAGLGVLLTEAGERLTQEASLVPGTAIALEQALGALLTEAGDKLLVEAAALAAALLTENANTLVLEDSSGKITLE